MKLANNECHLFVEYGSEIAYYVGTLKLLIIVYAEFLNLMLLAYQHLISHCIIHFVALEAIMEISEIFFESLMYNKLKEIIHHPPKLSIRGKDIKFSDRSCYHKLARIWYKIWRSIFASFLFYFLPFTLLFIQWNQH